MIRFIARTFSRTLLIIQAVLLTFGLPLPAQEATSPRPMNVEDVLALERVGRVTISPDGGWIAYVVTTRDFEEDRNETDLWVVATDPDGSPARRLTYREGADNGPQWHPDGGWLAFGSDRGEKRQVYGIRPDGGEAWEVTDFETAVGQFRFSPDGSHLAFTSSPEPTEAGA